MASTDAIAFTIIGRDRASRVLNTVGRNVNHTANVASRAMGSLIPSINATQLAFVGLGVAAVTAIGKMAGDVVVKAENVRAVFDYITKASRINGDQLIADAQRVTRGMVSELTIIEKAVFANQFGLLDNFSEYLAVATAAAPAMGASVEHMLDSIITGTARGTPLILDNLGLIIKAGEANQKYAQSIGKTVAALTEAEKKLAFQNEVVRAGQLLIARTGNTISDFGLLWSQLTSHIANNKDAVLQVGASWFVATATILRSSGAIGKLEEAFGWLRASLEPLLPILQDVAGILITALVVAIKMVAEGIQRLSMLIYRATSTLLSWWNILRKGSQSMKITSDTLRSFGARLKSLTWRDALAKATEFFQGLLGKLRDWLEKDAPDLIDSLPNPLSGLLSFGSDAAVAAIDIVLGDGEVDADGVSKDEVDQSLGDRLTAIAKDLGVYDIYLDVKAIVDDVMFQGSEFIQKVQDKVDGLVSNFTKWIKVALDIDPDSDLSFSSVWDSIRDKISEKLESTLDLAKEFIANIKVKLGLEDGMDVENIKTLISEKITEFKNFVIDEAIPFTISKFNAFIDKVGLTGAILILALKLVPMILAMAGLLGPMTLPILILSTIASVALGFFWSDIVAWVTPLINALTVDKPVMANADIEFDLGNIDVINEASLLTTLQEVGANIVTSLAPIKGEWDKLTSSVGSVMTKIGEFKDSLAPLQEPLGTLMQSAIDLSVAFGTTLFVALNDVILPVLGFVLVAVKGLLENALSPLDITMDDIVGVIESVRMKFDEWTILLNEQVTPAIRGLGEFLDSVFKMDIEEIKSAIAGLIESNHEWFIAVTAITGALTAGAIALGVKAAAMAAWAVVGGTVIAVGSNMVLGLWALQYAYAAGGISAVAAAVAAGVWSAASAVATAATTALGVAVGLLTSPITLIVLAIAGLIAIGVALALNWDEISQKISEIWDGISSKVIEVWNGITEFLGGILEVIAGFFQAHWDKILAILFPAVGLPILIARNWDEIKGIVSDLWDKITGFFKDGINTTLGWVEGFANGFINAVNSIISAWNNLSFKLGGQKVDLPFGQSFTIPSISLGTPDIPLVPAITLPRLFAGGIVRGQQPIIVGDNPSRTEAIVPLERANEFGFGGGMTVNVTIEGNVIGERQYIRQLSDDIGAKIYKQFRSNRSYVVR